MKEEEGGGTDRKNREKMREGENEVERWTRWRKGKMKEK